MRKHILLMEFTVKWERNIKQNIVVSHIMMVQLMMDQIYHIAPAGLSWSWEIPIV